LFFLFFSALSLDRQSPPHLPATADVGHPEPCLDWAHSDPRIMFHVEHFFGSQKIRQLASGKLGVEFFTTTGCEGRAETGSRGTAWRRKHVAGKLCPSVGLPRSTQPLGVSMVTV
jgi:hypothetical protein